MKKLEPDMHSIKAGTIKKDPGPFSLVGPMT